MKLLDLHLLAYGPFTDRHLDLSAGSEGLHVVFGPNEAGKSSALRALRALLYGVPERTQDDFRHDKTDLRVGGLFRGKDGTELHCYRRKGRKKTLLNANGEPLDEDYLARLLGGVAEPLFEQLFGIDHERLVSGGQALLVECGREAEALFSTGLGSTAVHAVLESLDQEAQSLFAPRASKPLINGGLSKLTDLERQQREVSLSARHWDEARKAVEVATARLNAIDAELATAARRQSTLERIRRSASALARREHILNKLSGLHGVPVLEDHFGQRREEALSRRRLAVEVRSKAGVRLAGLGKDIAGLVVLEELLTAADAIDALRDRHGGYHKAARDRPGLLARCSALAEQARQRFAEIRPDISLDDLETLRPLLGFRRRATELGGRQEALESGVKKARVDREATRGKLEIKQDELSRLPPPISPEVLQQAVAEARHAGDLDNALVEADAALVRHQAACQRELESLGLWTRTLAELIRAPLPGGETVQRFAQDFSAVEEEHRRLADLIAVIDKEQLQTEEGLLALRLVGEIPTELQLRHARERRDQGWHLLKRQWIDAEDVAAESRSYTDGLPLPTVFEAEIAGADEIADRLRRESQRVHEQAAAQARLEACRQRKADAEAALQMVALRRSALDRSWQEAWHETGLVPLPPREMSAWLVRASRLRDKAELGGELSDKVDALRRSREARRGDLRRALATCGQSLPEPLTPGGLRPLLAHAEACLHALEQDARRRTALAESIAELEEALRRLAGEVSRAEGELAVWLSDWTALMEALGRGHQTTPGEVSDYLQAIAEGLKWVDEAKGLQLRIDGIDQDARDFEQDVQALMVRLAPDLAGRPVGEALLELGSRLTAQREAKSRRDELQKQARQAEEELREADAEIRAAEEVLAELCRQAGCTNAEELETVEQRFLEQRDLSQQFRDVEAELIASGDGLSIAALASEAAQVDRDSVVAELTALNQRIELELRPAREAAFTLKLSSEREFQALAGSDQASVLADEVQQTLAEVREHTEKYVRLKLAARVLRDEIEAFRRQHRDPILTRATVYFRHLTCGSLTRIDNNFDESDQPVLVGVRANGERLRVEAMSTGTRDQLYLALRLAALEHFMETSEPLPLIVDDILIQFDDDRSRDTLGTLADFSAKTQVILFTHHERVVRDAMGLRDASARVFVHELA